MSDPTFGISITTLDGEPRPGLRANMSVAGLVVTAPAADAAIFPLNEPVTFFSDDSVMLAALGEEGTAYASLAAITEQLTEFEVAAQVVLVRVEQGATVKETIANLRGDINAKTGMFALLDAAHVLGVTPRIVAIPGYTSQAINQVAAAIVVTSPGSAYVTAPTVTFSGGGSDPGKVLPTGHAVLGTGADAGKVVAVVVDTRGENLTVAPTIAFAGGSGSGAAATATLDSATNAICASLPTLLDQLLAVGVVDGPASTMNAAIAWRTSLSSKRIIPVDPAYKVVNDEGDIVIVPKSPRAVGALIANDHEHGGLPSHSAANRAVRGIVGTSRPIAFSLLDGANEGQTLLSHNIGITVRGENTDGAIADGGYVLIMTDTCSADPIWKFYNQVRMRDFIHLMFIKTLRFYLGRYNLTGQTLQAVMNTMNFALRDLKAQQAILDYKPVNFDRDKNSPEQLRLGRFTLDVKFEEPAPLVYLGIQSARYRPALDILLSDLQSQLATAA
ncbi:phage tail protein [Kaistia sp. UC242_56]|uniref:phage tail protein n=1 Tax=Kaistia sp. UC242_56 TaxID=3374625 RepID=UPI0037B28F80